MHRVANFLAVPLLLVAACAGVGGAQSPPANDPQAPPAFKISVSVDLVLLYATVRGPDGQIVSGLRAQNFEVYEDGVKQTVRMFANEDTPVTVGLVVDHSGSMRTKMADVVAAARTFARSSNSEDEMFIVNFNENVTAGLPDSIRFTNHPEELEAAVLNTPAAGQTALYDATVEALERVQGGAREKRVLIVISDGGDNVSKRTLRDVLQMAGQSNTLVYTIGIFEPNDPDRNTKVLRQLARATGGEAFFPGELKSVVSICEGIARDIRSQYSLGYVSRNAARPGAYRKIRVIARQAESGKLSVRARAGYISGPGIGEGPQ